MPVRVPRRSFEDPDPLAHVTAPPENETSDEKERRIKSEREAQRISDAIDAELNKESVIEKRAPKAVKVLLLGQSESGKSTTLKNFQLMYETKAFRKERASWRAVIQLNIVRSIHVIFEAMDRVQTYNIVQDYYSSDDPVSASTVFPPVNADLLKLRMRLTPLLTIEEALIRRLSPSVSGEDVSPFTGVPNFRPRNVVREVAINSATPWKDVFSRIVPGGARNSFDSDQAIDWNDPNDPGRILHECAEDMKKLWQHETVQLILEKQNLRLEEMAGFFLDCLDEVTSDKYIPTDDHILRARLKTLGVSEHRIQMTGTGGGVGKDWRIFDVGGQRSLRHAWVPYFDDMDAIIFLAPISAFDQVLDEAPKVNRLEDSVLLWSQIVSNKILQNTDLILFLNKCDIMKAKLASGIRLRDYVVSYGMRENEFVSASSYLRKKFAGILKETSPVPRQFYCHLTSVVDMESTRKVIGNIKDMLMRENLKNSTLLM